MVRLINWRQKYGEKIQEIRSINFDWGPHDCLSGLVAPVTQAITGIDKFVEFRGKYKTSKGALKTMRNAGFQNLAELVGAQYEQAHISNAQIGDIATIAVDDKFGYSLGIVNGSTIFVLTPLGVETRDLMVAANIFKVN